MTFWACLLLGMVASLGLTRRRGVDLWSRVFWGALAGVGLWLVLLALGPGG